MSGWRTKKSKVSRVWEEGREGEFVIPGVAVQTDKEVSK